MRSTGKLSSIDNFGKICLFSLCFRYSQRNIFGDREVVTVARLSNKMPSNNFNVVHQFLCNRHMFIMFVHHCSVDKFREELLHCGILANLFILLIVRNFMLIIGM